MSLFSRAKQFVVKEYKKYWEWEKLFIIWALSLFILFFPTTAFDCFINDPQCENMSTLLFQMYWRYLWWIVRFQLHSNPDFYLIAMAYIFQALTILNMVRVTLTFLKSQLHKVDFRWRRKIMKILYLELLFLFISNFFKIDF